MVFFVLSEIRVWLLRSVNEREEDSTPTVRHITTFFHGKAGHLWSNIKNVDVPRDPGLLSFRSVYVCFCMCAGIIKKTQETGY